MSYIIQPSIVDFPQHERSLKERGAYLVLSPCEVAPYLDGLVEKDIIKEDKYCKLTHIHADGWTITGKLHADWFITVEDFTATHPKFGILKGNFAKKITATSKEAYEHFIANHRVDCHMPDEI